MGTFDTAPLAQPIVDLGCAHMACACEHEVMSSRCFTSFLDIHKTTRLLETLSHSQVSLQNHSFIRSFLQINKLTSNSPVTLVVNSKPRSSRCMYKYDSKTNPPPASSLLLLLQSESDRGRGVLGAEGDRGSRRLSTQSGISTERFFGLLLEAWVAGCVSLSGME
uniref:Uncharacterized protein n=1 Tax=Guillardia theta TaxID=55529 RepID=A0A7S4HA21_GUITH|mmetsp:Transcript_11736/g.40553  ORF Transcript_11736/g.40553 Transcript_11736/m.40553 type:complete len:165 (+) Transcript_11736:139-633(+)